MSPEDHLEFIRSFAPADYAALVAVIEDIYTRRHARHNAEPARLLIVDERRRSDDRVRPFIPHD